MEGTEDYFGGAYNWDVDGEYRILIGGATAGKQESDEAPVVGVGPILGSISLSDDGGLAAFSVHAPEHPAELYVMGPDDDRPRRLTNHNPWLSEVSLGKQEPVVWKARDGL